jgi:hypothetical protein
MIHAMPWIGVLVAAWLVVFFAGGVLARWVMGGVAPLTTGAWTLVVIAGGLLATAATTALAAGRWRQEAARDRARAAVPTTAVRRERQMGNGYLLLSAACVVIAVLIILVYRLVYTA